MLCLSVTEVATKYGIQALEEFICGPGLQSPGSNTIVCFLS